MRLLIQRVTEAKVEIEEKVAGQIGNGYLILLGAAEGDTKEIVDKLYDKMKKLRIFPDEAGKSNLSIQDVKGELLVVSQFTLYADCKKGNRPSFMKAGDPKSANDWYEYFVSLAKKDFQIVQTGEFGADMKVSLINDGPFTILLDSEEICK